ncbi:MAG: DotU family type IV/VI secretion system protein [Verrucomicrobia bacterium]|nr:DotU family type IV/VI secretion system protein [Verrucomicrobiota bacterium]
MNFQHWQDISFYLNEIDQERTLFGKASITPESMENCRKKIANTLEQIKVGLEQKLGKDYASLVLFALVAGVDEQMQAYDYNHLKVRWAPLQKDFYSAYTAGEVFFKTIDDILDNPAIPSLVYEVFYYVLKRGFQGKYRDSKTQLHKYIELLKDKIPVSTSHAKPVVHEQIEPAKTGFKAWHYYGFATLLFGVLYMALYVFSNLGG